MNRALLYLSSLFLLLIVSVLTSLNAGEVIFHFYFGSVSLPLALLLFIALLVGILIGVVATLGMTLTLYSEKRRLKRELKVREQEIRNLRDIPLKGRH